MEQKKDKKIENDEILSKKILDLCLYHQIEDSEHWVKLIDMQIKGCQLQINFLEDNKPFRFQKKKLQEYNKKIEELENKINNYYQEMFKEFELLEIMKNSIENI